MEKLSELNLGPSLALQHTGHETCVLIPTVLGLGCSKLRHKLGALLHQLQVEVSGGNFRVLKHYCSSVLAFCTDGGVESSLFTAPDLDLRSLRQHLEHEAAQLGVALSGLGKEPIEDELLYPFQAPESVAVASAESERCLQAEVAVVGERAEQAAAEINLALLGRIFPNALYIPGLKHSMDNVLHDIWSTMEGKDEFMSQLKALEYILKPPSLRDKLIHVLLDAEADCSTVERLKAWSSSLKSLRWHEVLNFVQDLLCVGPVLKQRWNLQKFVSALPKERHDELAEGRGPAGANTYKTVDKAMHSAYFWAFCQLMLDVSQAADLLSRWSESCWYHGDQCSEQVCAYKGAKCAEFAAGIHKYLLQECQAKANLRMSQLAPALREKEGRTLLSAWHCAHSRLQLEMQFKLHFWDLLPWKLCGLAANSIPVARVIARECQNLWNRMGPQQQRSSHPMTRRFLDHQWKGRSDWAMG